MHAYRTQYRPHIAQAIVAPGPVVTTPAPSSGMPAPEGLVWTAVAAAASYAGILTATREKGWKSAAGWVGGVAAGLAALAGLVGVVAPTYNKFPVRWYWV
jgi:hypothetical protein